MKIIIASSQSDDINELINTLKADVSMAHLVIVKFDDIYRQWSLDHILRSNFIQNKIDKIYKVIECNSEWDVMVSQLDLSAEQWTSLNERLTEMDNHVFKIIQINNN